MTCLGALATVLLLLAPTAFAAVAPSSSTSLSSDSCLVREMSRPKKDRPIIKLKNKKWKTMLSMDAGNFRAAIYSAILCEVEHAIKEALIAKKLVDFKSSDDFDVLIPDYFDVMPGCSAGTYIQSYMLFTGAETAEVFPIITATPGSALGSYQFMQGIAQFYNATLSSLPASQRSNYSVTGPVFAQGYNAFLSASFGNRTLQSFDSVRTSAVWAWTDLDGNTCLAPFMNKADRRGGMNTPSSEGSHVITDQENFYIWQMVSGATSWPPRVPPLHAVTTPDTPEKYKKSYAIADGIISSMDPTVLGIPFMLNQRRTTLKKLAILSLGSGDVYNTSASDLNYVQTVQQSTFAWNAVAANKYADVPLIKTIYDSIDKRQYLRIDFTFYTPDNCQGLFTDDVCPTVLYWVKNIDWSQVELYAEVGTQLSKMHRARIHKFVNRYLV